MPFYSSKCKKELDMALVMCPAWGVDQPPVGISYLKAYLSKQGITAKCFDFSLELYKSFPQKKYWDLNYPEHFVTPSLFESNILPIVKPFIELWTKNILKYNPKIVGFSLFKSSVNVGLHLAKHLRQVRPDLKIIGGGVEITRIRQIIIDGAKGFTLVNPQVLSASGFDILIEGEGEETLCEIVQLIKRGQDFSSVQGSLCMQAGKFKRNKIRKLIDSLDVLPPPDYHDFDLKKYLKESLPLVTSRGCVNRCTFCADSPLWKFYRCRSPEKVLAEIKYLIREYERNEFEIVDSIFNGDIERVSKLCDLIIESRLNIKWSAKVALNERMTYELLRKMKQAGCCSLTYGVESGSPHVLKDMRKNDDICEVKRIIKDTQKADINACCFFVIGYPTEREKDFQKTLDFIEENGAFMHRLDQITSCHIEEDSYLGRNLDKYGIVFKDDGWYSKESTPKIREERLNRFKELARKIHKHYKCEVQLK